MTFSVVIGYCNHGEFRLHIAILAAKLDQWYAMLQSYKSECYGTEDR